MGDWPGKSINRVTRRGRRHISRQGERGKGSFRQPLYFLQRLDASPAWVPGRPSPPPCPVGHQPGVVPSAKLAEDAIQDSGFGKVARTRYVRLPSSGATATSRQVGGRLPEDAPRLRRDRRKNIARPGTIIPRKFALLATARSPPRFPCKSNLPPGHGPAKLAAPIGNLCPS
jgi:hypothetical protein